MCYYQSPNRIQAGALARRADRRPPGPRTASVSAAWAIRTCFCCVGAVNRIVPNYIIHMWMATGDGGLAATLYGPCTVSALVGGGIP